ncbi:MAG: tetratricopeptide repeat protein [Bdellovibrionota bacterium]|nr:tetratricopeptide repeat protein [Bdellovibrionota bacterium]
MPSKYRIKLKNDRIVGPFNIKQVVELFSKGHINGEEQAQVFPTGDWKPIHQNKNLKAAIQDAAKGNKQRSSGDSTVVRLNVAKLKEEQKEALKKQKEIDKKKKLEELEKQSQEAEHQEFKFTREEPSQLVDYDELEKKFKESEPDPVAIIEAEENDSGVEKTRVIKRPKLNQDVDKTQVNPDALKWLKEQEKKEKEALLQKKQEEENKKRQEEEAKAEEVDFDESTQVVDLSVLKKVRKEARSLEKELITIDDEEDRKDKTATIHYEIEEEEDEPKKKKISPIVAFAFVAILWFLLDDDPDQAKQFEPQYLRVVPIITYEVSDPQKADDLFRKGMVSYNSGTYLGKVKASDFFRQSIEYKFKDNPALGMLILTHGELFSNVSNKSKGAATLFNLIKITRSTVYKNLNVAMGSALFYKNNGKINSAINLVENYLRVGDPSLKLLSLYLSLAIDVGDLVKAKKVMDKIIQYPNRPLEAYLAISRYYTLDEKYEEGKKVILEGLQNFPSSVALLLAYCEYLLREEDFQNYAATLKKIEGLKYEGSPTYYAQYLEYVGILSAYNKDTKTAAVLFKLALKINDTDSLRSKLASLDVGGGQLAENLILESKAIDLIRKSRKLKKEKKWEEAFKTAIEAVDLPVNFLPANINLVQLQIQRGFYESAIDTLSFLKKEHPVHPGINFSLIKALYESNKLDEAQVEVGTISNSILRTHPLYESTVGHFYEKSKQYVLAIKFLNQSVAKNPLRDQDYFLMAKIYFKSRQYTESKAKLAEAITLDPLNIEYKSLYANILFELEGADTAIGYLQQALEVNKDNPRLLGDTATFYYRNGQIAQFREIKEKVEKLNSEDPAFYEFMIKAAQIEEKTEDLISNAIKLLEVNPGDVETRMLLGKTLANVGRYQDALYQLNEVTKRLSTYPRVYYLIAKIYIQMKNYKSAIEAAKQERDNNPKIYNGHYILGETYRLGGKFTDASKNLEKAISINPKNVESLMSLGWIKLSQRDYDIARELYLRAKRQEPSNPHIRKQLGFIYQGIGQSGLAIEEFSTYLKLFPNAPDRDQVQNQIRALSR